MSTTFSSSTSLKTPKVTAPTTSVRDVSTGEVAAERDPGTGEIVKGQIPQGHPEYGLSDKSSTPVKDRSSPTTNGPSPQRLGAPEQTSFLNNIGNALSDVANRFMSKQNIPETKVNESLESFLRNKFIKG